MKIKGMIYDILGRQVHTLFNRFVQRGAHELEIGGDYLPAGLYVLRLETADGTSSEAHIIKR